MGLYNILNKEKEMKIENSRKVTSKSIRILVLIILNKN
jgi:hypothetical protein